MTPNTTAKLHDHGPYPEFDQYGQPTLEIRKIAMPCAVAKLSTENKATGSDDPTRGAASTTTTTAKLLFPAGTRLAIGQTVEVAGKMLRIMAVTPRFTLAGDVDHVEADAHA